MGKITCLLQENIFKIQTYTFNLLTRSVPGYIRNNQKIAEKIQNPELHGNVRRPARSLLTQNAA